MLAPRSCAALVLTLAACAAGDSDDPTPAAPPVLAGLDAAGLPALVRGRVLLGELGCVACHDPGDQPIAAAPGPDLATLGGRVASSYLAPFLAAPLTTEPGTTMPDLLRGLDAAERPAAAAALAHYLRSHTGSGPLADAPHDPTAAARGADLFGRIGCRACHGEATPFPHLTRKYTTATLRAFLLAPHVARPSRRMPDFALAPAEAEDLSQHLLGQGGPPAPPAEAIDAALVPAGRALFAALRCAACHALPDPERVDVATPPPLAGLDPRRGCLSGGAGPWPHYALSPGQRDDLRAALAPDDPPPTGPALVLQQLASRRCLACHRRDGIDALTPRLGLFGTDEPNLGDDGRIPPDLSGVGARLQRPWLARTIAHGQRERPYLQTRMPGFGPDLGGQLADQLAAVDAVDAVPGDEVLPLPADREAANAVLEIGRQITGERGMNCISCHLFAGEQAGAMGAIDLVHTTGERLRPEWFARYLRDPFRFKPNTLMPHFFPDGRSTRPGIADGDAARQIAGLWHYLAEGRNVRKPDGLRAPPIELVVRDETILLRRSVQGAGKRAIAVGHPGGVSLTFDAENLALNQVWWGRFLDTRPVWTSQGSGAAQILSNRRAELPNGPAFAALDRPDLPWPSATRRDRGDRWLGYDLGDGGGPTFRYTAGAVTVEDTTQPLPGTDGATILRRTLRLTGPAASLWFLAARNVRIEGIDQHTTRVGATLLVHCPDAPATIAVIEGQDARELRLPFGASPAGLRFTLDYRWQEEGR